MGYLFQIVLAILSGVLVCFSFPTVIFGWQAPELGGLGWLALVPLIFAVRRATPRRAFIITFISALIWYGGSVFWVYNAMHSFGGLSATISSLVLILLVLIISAYIALAPLTANFILSRWKGEMIVWLPVAWVAFEYLRNYFPCNGFPWSNIAMSQWRFLPIIQICDLVGVYGLMFLMVWVNVMITEIIAKLRGEKILLFVPKCVTSAVLVLASLVYGFWRLDAVPQTFADSPSLSVGIIQGNIPQELKWARKSAVNNLNVYREGARRLMESPVELIMWTEASFPWIIKTTDTDIDPKALGFKDGGQGEFPYTIFGAVSENPEGDFHNSAALSDSSGRIVGLYHKAHLVPFGEYIPYQKIFFFARKLTELAGTFLSGNSYKPLEAGNMKIGMLICYEDVFPEISRHAVRAGANFLANITNDAWFGPFSAQRQHLALSVFRAVENRRFMVRANNSGVSAVVGPTGEVFVESRTFVPALIVAPIALLDSFSPYTLFGDWFAWGSLAYCALGLFMSYFSFLGRIKSKLRRS